MSLGGRIDGWIANKAADGLNNDPSHRFWTWWVLREARAKRSSRRSEAGWIIQELVAPSEALLQCELALALDPDPRVRRHRARSI